MTIQLRDDHPWIRAGRTLYAKDKGQAMVVDWVRYHGAHVTVYVRCYGALAERAKVGGMPDYGAGHFLEKAISIAEVERRYQAEPIVDDELDIDSMAPMCPSLPTA